MPKRHSFWVNARTWTMILLGVCSVPALLGDQVEMDNGDRYLGHVVSLGTDTLTLQSEVLGTLKLPREKIANINFSLRSTSRRTNSTAALPSSSSPSSLAKAREDARTNATAELPSLKRQLTDNSNMVQQVQQQILGGGAGPEAQTKFNELLSGLMTGKLNLDDLRKEARSTLTQAQNAQKDMGDEGSSLNSYMAILESFLKDTDPPASTNSPTASSPAPRPLVGP